MYMYVNIRRHHYRYNQPAHARTGPRGAPPDLTGTYACGMRYAV